MMNFLFEKISVLLVGEHNANLLQAQQSNQAHERRWATRAPLKIRVNLYSNGTLVRHAIATDFSLNGMFLRCHQVDLRIGDEMALAIPEAFNGEEKWYPMQVKVSRVADCGVGMEFYQHNCQSFCCINKLMHVQNHQKEACRIPADSREHVAA